MRARSSWPTRMKKLGVGMSDRVATIGWNTYRHFELYYGISGIGAVMHTLNPRLFPDQLKYMVNHAEDKIMFLDLTFVPLAEKMAPLWPTVKHYIVLTDRAHMPQSQPARTCCATRSWWRRRSRNSPGRMFDENTASSLCYTSGTTGNPKGSLYSHRSTVLHSMAACTTNAIGFSVEDCVLPIVPMFHVNAWGVPYSAAFAGSKLVMPGPKLDGASVCELIEQEKRHDRPRRADRVAELPQLSRANRQEARHGPESLVRRFGGAAVDDQDFRREIRRRVPARLGHDGDESARHRQPPQGQASRPSARRSNTRCGRARAFRSAWSTARWSDSTARSRPMTARRAASCMCAGRGSSPAITKTKPATKAALDSDGWFKTGDVVVIDPEGYVQIVDRSKDVIKSGGEWISSIDVENAMMAHPDVAEAAVIGLPHPKWDERPLLIVVKKEGRDPQSAELLNFPHRQAGEMAIAGRSRVRAGNAAMAAPARS